MEQPAVQILLACLSYANQAENAEYLKHVSAEQWSEVAGQAQAHVVEPLLYHSINSQGIPIPAEIAERLKRKLHDNALRNIRLYQTLNQTLQRLREKQVAAIVLKGAFLAEAVYAEIGLRGMGDVDLLVKKEDLLKTEQELLALGYVPEDSIRIMAQDKRHFVYKLPKNGLALEMHWSILPDDYPIQVDEAGLWDRARPCTLVQAPALVLAPEDLLLHLCLHTAEHAQAMHLRMLSDIGEVVRHFGAELDWQGFGTRTHQWAACRPVYLILRLARELLAVPVPEDVLASIKPQGFDERYFRVAKENLLERQMRVQGARSVAPALVELWGPKSLSQKLAFIRKRLMPSSETLSSPSSHPANPWHVCRYYYGRLRDAFVNHGTGLWRLVRGDAQTRAAARKSSQVAELHDWMMSGE